MYLTQNVKAPNDVNGNPRRAWIVYDAMTGDVLSVVEEGYSGKLDGPTGTLWLNAAYSPELVPVNVTATEYRAIVTRCHNAAILRAMRADRLTP